MHDEERGNEIAYSLLTSSPKKKKKIQLLFSRSTSEQWVSVEEQTSIRNTI